VSRCATGSDEIKGIQGRLTTCQQSPEKDETGIFHNGKIAGGDKIASVGGAYARKIKTYVKKNR